jgi:hypothetical protein
MRKMLSASMNENENYVWDDTTDEVILLDAQKREHKVSKRIAARVREQIKKAESITGVAVLGGSANAPCPKCGHIVAFFSGKEGQFMSEVKRFASDTIIPLTCPIHGVFEVPAGCFRDKLSPNEDDST